MFESDSQEIVDGQRDAQGPEHTATLTPTTIEGVFLFKFPQVAFDNGLLTEVYHSTWAQLFGEPIDHLYFVLNTSRAREEWYYHQHTKDRYVLANGALEIVLFDARKDSATFGTLLSFTLTGLSETQSDNHGMVIAPGVWHSFRTVSETALFMNLKTPGYNRELPDKFRVSMPNDLCDFSWS